MYLNTNVYDAKTAELLHQGRHQIKAADRVLTVIGRLVNNDVYKPGTPVWGTVKRVRGDTLTVEYGRAGKSVQVYRGDVRDFKLCAAFKAPRKVVPPDYAFKVGMCAGTTIAQTKLLLERLLGPDFKMPKHLNKVNVKRDGCLITVIGYTVQIHIKGGKLRDVMKRVWSVMSHYGYVGNRSNNKPAKDASKVSVYFEIHDCLDEGMTYSMGDYNA